MGMIDFTNKFSAVVGGAITSGRYGFHHCPNVCIQDDDSNEYNYDYGDNMDNDEISHMQHDS